MSMTPDQLMRTINYPVLGAQKKALIEIRDTLDAEGASEEVREAATLVTGVIMLIIAIEDVARKNGCVPPKDLPEPTVW